ncbi:hypothetical protein Prudu_566S000100 [Prunus dulcis]|uniref:Uncharacterized protein n=1 Tax=Prunus dulcis TaxID=3755 RepID=A0A5H2XYE0_PRUDU|nr:hypothetical protein Prudu_566S000100 [Prunus dulcis]
MHCFQTRLKISISQRKLFVFFPVRALSEYLIVFLSSSSSSLNLNIDRLPLAFIARKRPRRFVSRLISLNNVCLLKMVSQQQTKDSGSKKLGMVAPQDKSSKEMKSSKKMKFASSSAETEQTSQTTISDDSKTGRGMSTMPRVVKRKLQKLSQLLSTIKGERSRGKKSVLTSAAKKWKDFKSTLTRHYILPYTNDKEKLSHPPETYKFIEKAQWDAFVASRLSKDFESEKLEYNHRLSRKGYAGLEDQLEETMPGVEIDRSTLWKRARQDKHGNIPDPKVAEKAKLIDELQKQVSEGKVRVDGSKDVLTMALGPEHPGRLRGVGAGFPQGSMLKQRISQSPKNPMSDKASCSGGEVKSLHYEDDNAKNGEHQQEEEKEEEKRDEEKEEEKEKKMKKSMTTRRRYFSLTVVIEVGDYSNMEAPSSLKSLCRYVETTLLPEDKLLQFTIDKEVFGGDRDTFLLPEDITQFAGMEEIGATVVAVYMRFVLTRCFETSKYVQHGWLIDPATVSANSGTIAERSRLVAARLQKTDGEQIFMMPYNPGRHWILLIVRAKKETVYFLDPLPGHRVVDEEAKNIVNSAIKMHTKATQQCRMRVLRYALHEGHHHGSFLGFENKYAKGNQEASYPQEAIDEVRNEWAEFVFQIIKQGNY